MQKFFLGSIAEYYINRYKTDLSSFCFVFPGRRAGLFFRHYLSSLVSTPVWSPQILTINEFFEELSPVVTADSISLLFDLHKVYKDVVDSDITFDEFISWGEMFLNDFNDIDKHLVDAGQLYRNLASLKELEDDYSYLTEAQRKVIEEFWGIVNKAKWSPDKEKFINVWDKLHDVYSGFVNLLNEKGEAYDGMHHRIIAEKIQKLELPGLPYEKIIFAGFNALTPVEDQLFEYYKNSGKADFFWDHSKWIINNSLSGGSSASGNYGAGFFIKDNIRKFPPPHDWILPEPENIRTSDITIVPVTTSLDQIREVTGFLSDKKGGDLSTALILADETMLIPALHGIPEKIEHVNITMGYPLKNTPAYGLTELLVNLQSQLRTGKDGKVWFHHKLVIPVIQHQYISVLADERSKELLKYIISKNRLFIEASEFSDNELFSLIFRKVESTADIPVYLKSIFERIFAKLQDSNDKVIEQEFIYTIYKTINRLEDILGAQGKEIEPQTWFRLLKKLLEFQTVPFEGEPLAGLQVMGILETRALDFENLIILNLNEGVFPRTAPPNTFIPYTLRKGFGLPTIEHQDNIFSYYFFRLIHRAKKVSLVYTTSTQGNRSGEMSRFIYLLKYLYPNEVKERTYIEEVRLLPSPAIITPKTGKVQNILNEFLKPGERELSPSSLSTYLSCPLKFYYSKIAEIKEPDEIIEDADARIFGLIFHDVAEKLYSPFKGKVMNENDLDKLMANTSKIKELVSQAFKKYLTDFDYRQTGYLNLYGKNSVVIEVVQKYILQFLRTEKRNCPFTVNDLEKEVRTTISTEKYSVNIKGVVDRIDMKDGIYRVIDYKTGASKNTVKDLKLLFDPGKHSDIKAVFQTILYSYLLYQNDRSRKYRPGILNIKDLYKNNPSVNIVINKKEILLEDVIDEFLQYLHDLLDEIFDPEIPFTQTKDQKKCEYCPYRILCNRFSD